MSDPDAKLVCVRILSDTVNDLAVRYGIEPVAMALTEIVGCGSCVSEAVRGAGLRELLEKLVVSSRRSN